MNDNLLYKEYDCRIKYKLLGDFMNKIFKKLVLVIVGESGSGKTTLVNSLANGGNYSVEDIDYKFKKVVTTTTRPIRKNEKDGVDYNFVSDEVFKDNENHMVCVSEYNGWKYGMYLRDIKPETTYEFGKQIKKVVPVIVLTPCEMRWFTKYAEYSDFNVFTVYLRVDRTSRLISLIETRDDIDESIRRNISDVGMFDGVENEVNCVLDNQFYALDVDDIIKKLLIAIHSFDHYDENIK